MIPVSSRVGYYEWHKSNKFGGNLWHKLKSRFLLSLLLATGLVLISCGGGGGGSGPTATTQPPSPPTQIIGRLNNLGSVQIGDFRFVPGVDNITLRWTNPTSPRAAISGFIITIRGMSSRTGGTQVSIDTQPIPYSGNGNPQTYSFRGLNGALYYEVDFQVVYTDNTGSTIIAVLTEIGSGGNDRRVLGTNTDGDDRADRTDNCQFDANPSQSDADGDGMGNACDSDAFTGNGGNAGGLTAIVNSGTQVTLVWKNPSLTGNLAGHDMTKVTLIRAGASRSSKDITRQTTVFTSSDASSSYRVTGLTASSAYTFTVEIEFTDKDGEVVTGNRPTPISVNTLAAPTATPTDSDGDGHSNNIDNCPNNANRNQGDADGDAVAGTGGGNVCDTTPAGAGIHVTQLARTVNSDTEVTLTWSNPMLIGHLANHQISKVTLIRAGASSASKDITSQTTVFTSSDAQSTYIVTGLTASSTYTFTVELEFTDRDRFSFDGGRPTPISATTNAATITPPPVIPPPVTPTPTDSDSDTIVNNLDNCPNNANRNQGDADGDAVAGTGGGNVCDATPAGAGIHVTQLARTVNSDTQVTLTWSNPMLSGNLANHTISKVTLIQAGASSASTVIAAAGVTHNSAAQSTYIVTGLTASSTYTFTIQLEFTDRDSFSFAGGSPTPISATTNAATIVPPPVTDSDGDTIVNNLDNCPNNANRNQDDADGDAVPGTGGGNVCDATPDGAGIHVTQLARTVNSDTQVTLTWSNPTLSGNLANHNISKVTLIQAGASSASTDITSQTTVFTSSAASSTYIVSGLTASSTYTFTIQLEFTDRDSFSFAGGSPTPISATTNAAPVIPMDSDNDMIPDRNDIDFDGDGLIEISTAAEFNAIRNNLAGTGLTLTAGGTGNSSGCPSATSPGTDRMAIK